MPVKRVHVQDHDRRKPHQQIEIHVDDYNRMQDINPRPPPGANELGPATYGNPTLMGAVAIHESETDLVNRIRETEERASVQGGMTEDDLYRHERLNDQLIAMRLERWHPEGLHCDICGKPATYMANGHDYCEDCYNRTSGPKDPLRDIDKEVEEIEAIEKELGRSTVHEELGWKQRGMKLLTQADRKKLPKLYETEKVPVEDKVLRVKFFTPTSNWTWYATEFDGEDTFFGYVEGMENEWGYFSLKELSETKGPMGVGIERDKYWQPTKFGDYIARKG